MVKRAFKDEMTFQGTDHDVGDHGVLPTAEDNHVVNPTRLVMKTWLYNVQTRFYSQGLVPCLGQDMQYRLLGSETALALVMRICADSVASHSSWFIPVDEVQANPGP